VTISQFNEEVFMKRTLTLISVSTLLAVLWAGFLGTADAGQAKGSRKGAVSTPVLEPLTEAEAVKMLFVREEEKLARDVYIAMSEIWKDPVFANIVVSEQRHMDAVLKLLVKYGIPDPAAGNGIGEFTDPALQDLYDTLVGRGRQSIVDAYLVGVDIEMMDIHDLLEAIAITNDAGLADAHADVVTVYANLKTGSEDHLAAFSSHLER